MKIIFTTIEKIKAFAESHKDSIDLTLGAGIGAGTGANHYWEHFTDPENLFKLYDGIINTGLHTIVGAVLFWALHKFVFKSKKNGKN